VQKEIVEVPVLSEVIRKIGVPLLLVQRVVFVSGTPPFNTETGQLVRGDIPGSDRSLPPGRQALSGERGNVARPGGDGAGLREQRWFLSDDQSGLGALLPSEPAFSHLRARWVLAMEFEIEIECVALA
jgi:2-iminobutanoate/2-iminopropanoate deaminase